MEAVEKHANSVLCRSSTQGLTMAVGAVLQISTAVGHLHSMYEYEYEYNQMGLPCTVMLLSGDKAHTLILVSG